MRWRKAVCGGTLATAIVGGGCSFAGSDPTAEADLEQSSSGVDQADESSGPPPGSTAGSHGNSQGNGSSSGGFSDTTGAPVDPNDSADVDLRALLAFADAPQLDLGTVDLGGADALSLTVENVGQAAADITDPPPLEPPLIWAGGDFPGNGGDCGGLLAPGSSCTVAVAVAPGQPGLLSRDVQLDYDDGIETQAAELRLDLIAAGVGPNLFANPRADADPPGDTISNWTQGSGDFSVDSGCGHGAGSTCFFAGSAGHSVLLQDVDLSDHATSIDELGLGLLFEGWSESGGWTDDPHDIRLEFFSADDTSLLTNERSGMDHTNWESTTFAPAIPAGARRMRLRLACDRNWGSNCSAWFDDFVGQLVYPPPG